MKSIGELCEIFNRFKGMIIHRELGAYPKKLIINGLDGEDRSVALAGEDRKHGAYRFEDIEGDSVEREIIEAIKTEGLEPCIASPGESVFFDELNTVYVYLDLSEGQELNDTMIGSKIPLVVDSVSVSGNFSQSRHPRI